jgi:hypothetical protein
MGFDITAEGPAGRDIVIAIASRKPIDLSSLNLSEVDQSGISASRDLEAGARLFRVAAKPGAEDPISVPSSVLPSDGYAIAYVIAEVTN